MFSPDQETVGWARSVLQQPSRRMDVSLDTEELLRVFWGGRPIAERGPFRLRQGAPGFQWHPMVPILMPG